LSTKAWLQGEKQAWLQGEKHSKVEHLASIFNAAGAFLSQNIAA
jgi:hypothetical protein